MPVRHRRLTLEPLPPWLQCSQPHDEHDGSQRQQQGVQAYPALSIDQFRTALITGAPPATRTANVSEKCTSPG